MQQYLHLVDPNKVWNYQLAKVYYQGGEICSSTKALPDYVNASTVAELIQERKQYLEQKVVQYVTRRLDEANTGEI
jgi:hypothetical protein